MQQFRPAGNCILEKGKPVARPGRKAMGPEFRDRQATEGMMVAQNRHAAKANAFS